MIKGKGKVLLPDGTKVTQFEYKWGISATELARLEGVEGASIHMRVMNYGTPFQRRAKLSKWEVKYGLTIGQIAEEIGIHPITVAHREVMYGSPYHTPAKTFTCTKTGKKVYAGEWNLGIVKGKDWRTIGKWKTASKPTFFKLEDILKQ
jgi:hypothetical protein|tara:strand:+ start:765 stop:1211 length:447 start_codon:yes stop_codon:yes gene_type:complete